MSTLRKALGATSPEDYIETVAKAGYRLAVPVRILSEADLPRLDETKVAVRAFSTRDLAESDTYLGVGIADAVATMLGVLPGLAVSPVGAVEDLVGARDAGLEHVLEGAVQRTAGQLHVATRLIDVASGRTQWSEHFERPLADSAVLQDAIAERVANSLAQQSAVDRAGLRSHRPRSSEAYLLQLQARANLRLHARLPALKALGLFEQALALEPEYALAHAGVASTYLLLASTMILRPLPVDEAMPLARQSAEWARARDEGLAEAWAVLGRVKLEYDWDWDGAAADLAHAVALNPSSVDTLAAYGHFLGTMGRHDEALETMEQARCLDPRRLETLVTLAMICWNAGEADRALAILNDASMFAPYTGRAGLGRVFILDQLGRRQEAMSERLAWLRRQTSLQGLAERLAELDRREGWPAAMAEWIALLERTNRWPGAAMQWMAVDKPVRALDALERCVTARTTYLGLVLRSPSFRPLRGQLRFQRFEQMVKLDRGSLVAMS